MQYDSYDIPRVYSCFFLSCDGLHPLCGYSYAHIDKTVVLNTLFSVNHEDKVYPVSVMVVKGRTQRRGEFWMSCESQF